jgi:hypothetical protein
VVPHLFGWSHVMPSSAFEIAAGDFAFAVGHRLTAISLFPSTLNSAAALSIAVASSQASTSPRQTALLAILYMLQLDRLRRFGFLCHAASIYRSTAT